MNINAHDLQLHGLGKINIVLGKNGSGKSRTLRHFDSYCRKQKEEFGLVKYITPERGGEWKLNPSVEINLRNSPEWSTSVRSTNRYEQYRQIVMSEFSALEIGFFRRAELDKIDGKEPNVDFRKVLEKINGLLENIKIVRPDTGSGSSEPYPVVPRDGGSYGENFMSSGEAELVALGCEIVSFSHHAATGSLQDRTNIIFIDEPDVHLHPDLQYKLMSLLVSEVKNSNFCAVIATHSTAIVAALSGYTESRVAFMTKGQTVLEFQPITAIVKSILPIFGAHPLSNVFNESPILLVEGDDDERIWQQAIRSSKERIKLWPRQVGGKGNLQEFESKVEQIAQAIYDEPKCYSLRDGDDSPEEELVDSSVVMRMRLGCRSAENLILSTQVLISTGVSWDELKARIENWLSLPFYSEHPQRLSLQSFKDSGFDRRNFDLKDIRNIILMLLGVTKPWEVLVGQVIASEKFSGSALTIDGNSLTAYLGSKLVKLLYTFQPKNLSSFIRG